MPDVAAAVSIGSSACSRRAAHDGEGGAARGVSINVLGDRQAHGLADLDGARAVHATPDSRAVPVLDATKVAACDGDRVSFDQLGGDQAVICRSIHDMHEHNLHLKGASIDRGPGEAQQSRNVRGDASGADCSIRALPPANRRDRNSQPQIQERTRSSVQPPHACHCCARQWSPW